MSEMITGTPTLFSKSFKESLSLMSVSPPPSHKKPPGRSPIACATNSGGTPDIGILGPIAAAQTRVAPCAIPSTADL